MHLEGNTGRLGSSHNRAAQGERGGRVGPPPH
jgi:hypothetical protein